MYAAVSWPKFPCVMLRISAYLSACFESNGSSSLMRTPATLVSRGRMSGPA